MRTSKRKDIAQAGWKRGAGVATVQYKLRDWLFSRQRYWGEPFPILHGPEGQVRAVEESELPVLLPEMEDLLGRPQATRPEAHRSRRCRGRRTRGNTLTWTACASRANLTRCRNGPARAGTTCGSATRGMRSGLWGPTRKNIGWAHVRKGRGPRGGPGGVDLYVGGAEHAVLHLLYARFWHKVLFDLGHVSTAEPFGRLFNQGYIQAHAYVDARGIYVAAEEVEERKGGKFLLKGEEVRQNSARWARALKMP